MKGLKAVLLGLIMVVTMSSCSKVPAGNVGVKFHLLGQDKGVDYDVLTPGRYWIGYNEELFLYQTYNQTKLWTSDVRAGSQNDDDFNFQSNKGLKLSASISIEYHVKPENVPAIFETYKRGLDEVTNKVLRNALRDAFNMAASQRTAEQMYGSGKIEFMDAVTALAKIEAEERGITIDDIYLVGNIIVPNSITDALESKIKATQLAQQKENELRQTEADAAKVIVKSQGIADALIIKADAEAKANRIVAASLTKSLIDYNRVEKWDGKLPGVTGGAVPFLNLNQ